MQTKKIKLHSQQSLTDKLQANQGNATAEKDAAAQKATQWATGGFAGA
jgi:hypothetical protein